MSSCATITRPESGLRNPMIFINDTDLPTPLRPRMHTVSPGITLKLTWSSTRLSPKALETSLNSMYGPGLPFVAMNQSSVVSLQASADINRLIVNPPDHLALHTDVRGSTSGLFPVFLGVQIAEHLLRKTVLLQFFPPNHFCLDFSEQTVDLVP